MQRWASTMQIWQNGGSIQFPKSECISTPQSLHSGPQALYVWTRKWGCCSIPLDLQCLFRQFPFLAWTSQWEENQGLGRGVVDGLSVYDKVFQSYLTLSQTPENPTQDKEFNGFQMSLCTSAKHMPSSQYRLWGKGKLKQEVKEQKSPKHLSLSLPLI